MELFGQVSGGRNYLLSGLISYSKVLFRWWLLLFQMLWFSTNVIRIILNQIYHISIPCRICSTGYVMKNYLLKVLSRLNQHGRRVRTTLTCFAISLGYLICWLPIFIYKKKSELRKEFRQIELSTIITSTKNRVHMISLKYASEIRPKDISMSILNRPLHMGTIVNLAPKTST